MTDRQIDMHSSLGKTFPLLNICVWTMDKLKDG